MNQNEKQPPIPSFLEKSALLDIKQVGRLIGLQPPAIYRRIRQKTFPEPVRLSVRCSRWRAGDVHEFLLAQTSTGPARAAA